MDPFDFLQPEEVKCRSGAAIAMTPVARPIALDFWQFGLYSSEQMQYAIVRMANAQVTRRRRVEVSALE